MAMAHHGARRRRWAAAQRARTLPVARRFRYVPRVPADQRRVADLLVRCLEHEGVTCVFGIPAEENIRFTDALARFDQVTDVTDKERDAAFNNIKAAARHYEVTVSENSWRELGKPH